MGIDCLWIGIPNHTIVIASSKNETPTPKKRNHAVKPINYFTSSDPHRHKNTVIPVCHGSDIYSDILSGTSFWQGRVGRTPLMKSRDWKSLDFIMVVLSSSSWLGPAVPTEIWSSQLKLQDLQCRLSSGAGSWGPAVHTEIWSWQLGLRAQRRKEQVTLIKSRDGEKQSPKIRIFIGEILTIPKWSVYFWLSHMIENRAIK